MDRSLIAFGCPAGSEGLLNSDINSARRNLQPRNRRLIRRSGRKLKHAIAVLASVIVLGTILLLASVATEQREASEERAWNDVDNLSGAFEEQVYRVLDDVRGAIALLKLRLTIEGAAFNLVDWAQRVPEFATSTVQIAMSGRMENSWPRRSPATRSLSICRIASTFARNSPASKRASL